MILPAFQRQIYYAQNIKDMFLFLNYYVGANDVVLSDLQTSWYIPAFSGKVVASVDVLNFYFLSGGKERKEDLIKIMFTEITDEEKTLILRKYQVKYVLVNKTMFPGWKERFSFFLNSSKFIIENNEFVLIGLKNLY
jgi:hypothetical protein